MKPVWKCCQGEIKHQLKLCLIPCLLLLSLLQAQNKIYSRIEKVNPRQPETLTMLQALVDVVGFQVWEIFVFIDDFQWVLLK